MCINSTNLNVHKAREKERNTIVVGGWLFAYLFLCSLPPSTALNQSASSNYTSTNTTNRVSVFSLPVDTGKRTLVALVS